MGLIPKIFVVACVTTELLCRNQGFVTFGSFCVNAEKIHSEYCLIMKTLLEPDTLRTLYVSNNIVIVISLTWGLLCEIDRTKQQLSELEVRLRLCTLKLAKCAVHSVWLRLSALQGLGM